MSTPFHEILQKTWGYDKFRPYQLEIIKSIFSGRDTVAVLPTGGGKSLCYQVPTLLMEGLCIVVSPLVALMQDQVKELKEKNIRATMIVSGMSERQIDHAYGNCIHGDYQFLYVSPERLQNQNFLERVKEMNVSLIAVDEAHCISQWGFDFRPTYLEISTLRDIHDVPILALTATATNHVVNDITEHLELRDHKLFKSSIKRTNLSFQVREATDKFPKLLEIIQYFSGSTIVYTMSRKTTQLLVKELEAQGVSATAYHAGLDYRTREKRQKEWIDNKVQVMVATNAFGMGINKNDVRVVIHYHVPESIEAYYQEAGRAGRNGKNAFAFLLWNENDIGRLNESKEDRYPGVEILRNILIGLFQHLQIAFGDGPGRPYNFQLYRFAKRYDLSPRLANNAIDSLIRQAWFTVSDAYFSPSSFRFKVSNKELYRFQVNSPDYEIIVKYLLRNYTGIFEQSVRIDEEFLAKKIDSTFEAVKTKLEYLHKAGIGAYYPQNEEPLLSFLQIRPMRDEFLFNTQQIDFLRNRHHEKIDTILDYISTPAASCRTKVIQDYFNELQDEDCGICDLCSERKNQNSKEAIQSKANEIVDLLQEEAKSYNDIINQLKGKKTLIDFAIQLLLNEEMIEKKDNLWQKK